MKKKEAKWKRIFKQLRENILAGLYSPGELLCELQLSKYFKVSRTPVREALKGLEKEGLITKIKNKGFFVRRLNEKEVVEVMEIRGLLEGYAASLATKNVTKKDIDKLKKLLEEAEVAAKQGDFEKFMKLGVAFHDYIYRLSGNRTLFNLIQEFRSRFTGYRRLLLRIPGVIEEAVFDHYRILELLSKKDTQGIYTVMQIHAERGKERFLQTLKNSRKEKANKNKNSVEDLKKKRKANEIDPKLPDGKTSIYSE